ncbi:hypothetical protein PFISCL1PPCAC_27445 [Pristionchus fissidentatus]|uniref:Tetraspanin n=1 Tax=Pristionchus fissidentatus TaxID=1538716 RepID=A0AAV5X0Z3_9BILA|nr:hypothetical protein PFISCL1PPCAC_27445 [Pristionchus fissidentatus]
MQAAPHHRQKDIVPLVPRSKPPPRPQEGSADLRRSGNRGRTTQRTEGTPRENLLRKEENNMGDGYDARLMSGSAVRKRKPRQEISACLKWICFFINFIAFLIGLFILSLGIYLCVKDPRGVADWADVVLNPAIMLAIIGFLVCVITMAGAVGALRDNISLLKTFAMSVFFCYIVIVLGTFCLFILFYADNPDGISAQTILMYSIGRYHNNRNIADLVDYLQEQLECCGVSSVAAGFRDWGFSSQFNCTDTNPYPEKCGVPYSCCRRSVVSEAAGSANPLLPAMRSLECWQNALKKRPQDIENDIHTRGCLLPLRSVFETHALHIGMVVAVIIIPVSLSVCIANILARQIDHQKWLLEREARRHDRRRKRDRSTAIASSAFRQMEAGVLPEIPQHQQPKKSTERAPKLPDTPPPDKPPVEFTNQRKTSRAPKGTRAASTSPNRKMSSGSRLGQGETSKKEKRQRSVPPKPSLPSSSNARTHHWILQQSDLVNPRPSS